MLFLLRPFPLEVQSGSSWRGWFSSSAAKRGCGVGEYERALRWIYQWQEKKQSLHLRVVHLIPVLLVRKKGGLFSQCATPCCDQPMDYPLLK